MRDIQYGFAINDGIEGTIWATDGRQIEIAAPKENQDEPGPWKIFINMFCENLPWCKTIKKISYKNILTIPNLLV